MHFMAAGNRCAVSLEALRLEISSDEAINLLTKKGFKLIEVDIIGISRSLIGTAEYRRGARPSEAPQVIDCSGLIKWVYSQKGVWLPRRSIQQREFGTMVEPSNITAGDVVFASGRIDYYDFDPYNGVGHVGLATGDGTVVHAANRKVGIIESPIEEFLGNDHFRGVCRIIPSDETICTFISPPNRVVEYSDDFRWIILQNL